jgi:hypothetical protein
MSERRIHPRKAVLLIAQLLQHLLSVPQSDAGHYLRVWITAGDVCGEWGLPGQEKATDWVDEDDVRACIADVLGERVRKNSNAGCKPKIGRDGLYQQFKSYCDKTGEIPKDVRAWVTVQAALRSSVNEKEME